MLAVALDCSAPPKTSIVNAATIVLHAPSAILRVQVAKTEVTRERGLMCVRSLPEHTGMLFVFDADGLQGFWMKNTLIPLDMVFVDSHGRITSIAADVPIASRNANDAQIPRRGGEAKYVIELPAGEARKDGLKSGSIIPELSKGPVARTS